MRAMILASVVLPTPGGPQKISEPVSSRSICTRSGLPGPRMCSCPTNSSSVRGRMRSASGRDLSTAGSCGRDVLEKAHGRIHHRGTEDTEKFNSYEVRASIRRVAQRMICGLFLKRLTTSFKGPDYFWSVSDDSSSTRSTRSSFR